MRRSIRHLVLLVALATAPVTLAGCGMSLVPKRLPWIGGSSSPKAKPKTSPAGAGETRATRQRVSSPVPGGLDDRLADAREQAALAPAEAYWPYRIGQLYAAADSTAQADASLRAALVRDRFYAPALSLLSKLDFERGRHQQAIDRLEAARAESGRFPNGLPPALLAGLALHYDALGRLDLARAVMAQLPRELEAVAPAAVYVKLRGETPDSATTLAASARAGDPRSAANQNNFGITRLRAGDPVAARKAFLAAIDLDPKLAGPYYNLAIVDKYYVFDDDGAAKWFKQYWARSKDDPDSLFAVFGRGAPLPLAEGNEP